MSGFTWISSVSYGSTQKRDEGNRREGEERERREREREGARERRGRERERERRNGSYCQGLLEPSDDAYEKACMSTRDEKESDFFDMDDRRAHTENNRNSQLFSIFIRVLEFL